MPAAPCAEKRLAVAELPRPSRPRVRVEATRNTDLDSLRRHQHLDPVVTVTGVHGKSRDYWDLTITPEAYGQRGVAQLAMFSQITDSDRYWWWAATDEAVEALGALREGLARAPHDFVGNGPQSGETGAVTIGEHAGTRRLVVGTIDPPRRGMLRRRMLDGVTAGVASVHGTKDPALCWTRDPGHHRYMFSLDDLPCALSTARDIANDAEIVATSVGAQVA